IQSGSSIEAYQSSSVAYGETCVSEMRKCDNGKLFGSYTNGSCKVTEGESCSLEGTTIKSGKTITAYKDATVMLGSGTSCSSETRQCDNGTLSGSYANKSCDVIYYNTNLLGDDGNLKCVSASDYLNKSTNPDCTCRTERLQSSNICTFNSWAHAGNNYYECHYTCTLPPQKATSIQIANCTLSSDGIINCTP
ncbi:MAG: hypothetical protein HY228_00485, partial [Candidatus Yonathbacteria bacterium]|nr:hypothetical protein [Candidatus Yonathbacteria bacterium]